MDIRTPIHKAGKTRKGPKDISIFMTSSQWTCCVVGVQLYTGCGWKKRSTRRLKNRKRSNIRKICCLWFNIVAALVAAGRIGRAVQRDFRGLSIHDQLGGISI